MVLFAPEVGLNVLSILPFVFNLAIWLQGVPLYDVNSPAIIIFPSDCKLIVLTLLFGPVPITNPASIEPFAFNLAIFLLAAPLYVVNNPPISIIPSLWILQALIAVAELVGELVTPVPILKVASILPEGVILTIPFLLTPLKLVNAPPAIMFWSAWMAIE